MKALIYESFFILDQKRPRPSIADDYVVSPNVAQQLDVAHAIPRVSNMAQLRLKCATLTFVFLLNSSQTFNLPLFSSLDTSWWLQSVSIRAVFYRLTTRLAFRTGRFRRVVAGMRHVWRTAYAMMRKKRSCWFAELVQIEHGNRATALNFAHKVRLISTDSL